MGEKAFGHLQHILDEARDERKVADAQRWDDPMRPPPKAQTTADGRPARPWPANRFNIPPGPEWDGVDRSNGFEARYLRADAERAARREAEYRREATEYD